MFDNEQKRQNLVVGCARTATAAAGDSSGGARRERSEFTTASCNGRHARGHAKRLLGGQSALSVVNLDGVAGSCAGNLAQNAARR
jgi:hypothetical protein